MAEESTPKSPKKPSAAELWAKSIEVENQARTLRSLSLEEARANPPLVKRGQQECPACGSAIFEVKEAVCCVQGHKLAYK